MSAVITAVRNRAIVNNNGPVWNLLLDFKFLLPMIIIASLPTAWYAKGLYPTHLLIRISRVGVSAFMSLGLLLVGVGLARFHYFPGAAGILFAAIMYGVRVTLVKEKETLIDQLTEIPNRRFLDETIEHEWYRSSQTRQPIAILMIDVDHFKLLNDRYGHHHGDQVLTKIAKTLQTSLNRATDFIGRYGGEEFLVILPGVEAEGAFKVAQKLCTAISQLSLESIGSPHRYVTISIGVALGSHSDYKSPDRFIAAADRALYRAKKQGRNCVEFIEEDVRKEQLSNTI